MSAVMGSGPRDRKKLGISDYAGGPDPVHGLDAPRPNWRLDADWAQEQARHQRRMQLMRMQGDCNRQERRMYIWWTVAAVLGVLALIGSML
jgi:hypothetical protein